VVNIAQDKPIALWLALRRRCKTLDLDALAYWYWEISLQPVGVIEDGAA
jgi:hypothetical protein